MKLYLAALFVLGCAGLLYCVAVQAWADALDCGLAAIAGAAMFILEQRRTNR